MFALFLEIITLILVVLFIVTQILLPAKEGRTLFPMFRRESKLKTEIAETEQQLHEEELEQVLAVKKTKLKKAKKSTKSTKGVK